jgi:hypothetical protein
MDDIDDFGQQQNQQQRGFSKSCAAHTELGKYIHPKYHDLAWAKQLDPNFTENKLADDEAFSFVYFSDRNEQGLPEIDWEESARVYKTKEKAREAARPVNKNVRPAPFVIEPVSVPPEEKINRENLRASLATLREEGRKAKEASSLSHTHQEAATSIIDRVDCRTMDRTLLRRHLQKERDQEILATQQRKKD